MIWLVRFQLAWQRNSDLGLTTVFLCVCMSVCVSACAYVCTCVCLRKDAGGADRDGGLGGGRLVPPVRRGRLRGAPAGDRDVRGPCRRDAYCRIHYTLHSVNTPYTLVFKGPLYHQCVDVVFEGPLSEQRCSVFWGTFQTRLP
jgi:hypothetical protein